MARSRLIFLILGICAASFYLNIEKGVLPVLLNLSLLPLGIIAYTQGIIFGFAGAIICAGFFAVYIIVSEVELKSVMPGIFAFLLAPPVFCLLRTLNHNMEAILQKDLVQAEKALEDVRAKDAGLDTESREADGRVSELVTLYEVTKDMSSTLLFGEIFHIFSDFLKRNFKFLTCKLILVKEAGEGGFSDIEKVYRIDNCPPVCPADDGKPREETPSVVEPELVDIGMINEIAKNRKIIFWEDFTSIPLITQDKIIGVLNVEGLDPKALEKFLIVARQFSLEVEKVRLYETVQELAITDGLTGVFMRRYFLAMFKEEMERAARNNLKLSFLMVDIDYFKACNDRYGHLVGDEILREIAAILKTNCREIDLMGRYGGEEFVLLLPETDKQGALFLAERLRRSVEQNNFKAYDELLRFTISIGVATFPEDAARGMELIEAADQSLYEAKQKGRNRVCCQERQ